MCVICVKPSGVAFPDKNTMFQMFRRNSDGAGFMYVKDGKVHIQKGFMHFKSFYRAYKKADLQPDETAVFHFRIATAGSKTPGNTHPFPITDDVALLKATVIDADYGLAHNGILSFPVDKDNDLSDTMSFIREALAGNHIIELAFDKKGHKLLTHAIGSSKMAIMRNDGTIAMLGSWFRHDHNKEDKCWYSNIYFTPAPTTTYNNAASNYSSNANASNAQNSNVTNINDRRNHRGSESSLRSSTGAIDYDLDSIVEVNRNTKDCPRCKNPIGNPLTQVACTKCGVFFDNVVSNYGHWH